MSLDGTAATVLPESAGIPAIQRDPFQDRARQDASLSSRVARAAGSRSRPYIAAVVCAGCLVLGWSIQRVSITTPPTEWWLLAVLTLFSGAAVLKIPGAPVNFSISDVFTLTAAVAFGPAAGTVIVALDSLAISTRLRRAGLPGERILFNAAAPPLAMWVSAQVF